MDIATILGLLIGFGAILGGQAMEGGSVKSLIQPTAAIIILGGTFGATLISFPLKIVLKALKDAKNAVMPPHLDPMTAIKDIISYASKARKNGLISLEQDANTAKDPFLKNGLTLLVDGIEAQKIRETLEIELTSFEEHQKGSVEVFESAGGYAPTIGIIGAVLGLIQVMNNLSDASKLGEGIAVAFVATIYGLVTANIVCLPIGTKLKLQMKEDLQMKEMLIEGLISIQNGENPHFIERKLKSFIADKPEGGH